MSRAFAPGKLVLTGAYAVLEGAPAIAVAVSRGATADSSRVALMPTPEVLAAFDALGLDSTKLAPHADASAMFIGSRKLGLGASAAILVASLAAREADAGADLSDPRVREQLFTRARAAHAVAQEGGSGVDVATSVYGGAISYAMNDAEPVKRVTLPKDLHIEVFACGTSARTSELRAEITRLAANNPALHYACMNELIAIANDAAEAVRASDGAAFVESLRRTARGLARLGSAAQIGIVPTGFDALEAIAAREEASFSVAGAGGGDVAVYVGRSAPTQKFIERAHALGLFSLAQSPESIRLDKQGVRIVAVQASSSPRVARTHTPLTHRS